jgi:glycosyltransferase involved in cell wall biosynthesis
MRLAVSFTNLGPYHLARLRALGERLRGRGGELIAYETAATERKYPWAAAGGDEPFRRVTLFPRDELEALDPTACRAAIVEALDADEPDAVALAGYVRPEVLSAAGWARARGRPVVLMSESTAIDRPRVWWREAVKRRRLRRFDAALVGGPPHREYLAQLGFSRDRIALGYNAVDGEWYARASDAARSAADARAGLPARPYVLAVSRFAPEKNLPALVRAFAEARRGRPFDLVLCGSGPDAGAIEAEAIRAGVTASVHRPGFLGPGGLARWYAGATALILPSLSEPWGLVANEAAASGLPLLVSERAGCASTLVPALGPLTGRRFDPRDEGAMAEALRWVVALPEPERRAIGQAARTQALAWGPGRFADGMLEAVGMASRARRARRRRV